MVVFHWYIDILLIFVAFIAAIIDTLAGGGGLITAPALLISGLNPLFSFGTMKFQGAISELSATLHFVQNTQINYKKIWTLFFYVVISSAIGTICLQLIPVTKLEKIIPFLLLGVLVYYLIIGRRRYNETNHVIHPN